MPTSRGSSPSYLMIIQKNEVSYSEVNFTQKKAANCLAQLFQAMSNCQDRTREKTRNTERIHNYKTNSQLKNEQMT